jgi:molybdopterin-guanine dinucleotide biosynthesis protein B
MKILGIAGWSGSGKTTLIRRLIPLLAGQGVGVATLKHSHHDVRVGDADSAALLAAGAGEVLIAAPHRFALLHDHQGRPEPSLADLTAHVAGCDLLLVEGFKFSPHPKLEVWTPESGKPPLAAADPTVVAVACDVPLEISGRPVLARSDAAAICRWVLDFTGLARLQD